MEKSTTFQDLVIWQKAHAFVLLVYACTESFPKHEIYDLISQYRRAAVSIAANIAEGYNKKEDKSKLNFLNIAHSFLEECRCYILLFADLGYKKENKLNEQVEEVNRVLTGCAKAILQNHTGTRQPTSGLLTL